MARYIDADLFKQCVQDNITRYFTCGTGGYCLAEDVVEDIDAFPAADVVPKSEVEQIFAEIDEAIDNLRGAFLRQRISEIKREHGVSIK